jgi:hypothetical protein
MKRRNPGSFRELGAANAVVDVRVLVEHGPALCAAYWHAWSIWRATELIVAYAGLVVLLRP